MTVRLLADREPYASYATERDPTGSLFFCADGDGEGAGRADVVVLPAELLLSLPPRLRPGGMLFAYGPVSLMAPAFDAGCHDYLREPWSLAELRARAARLDILRFAVAGRTLELRGALLSVQEGTKDVSIRLSEPGRRLLRLLARNGGKVVTRQAIALELWDEAEGRGRTLDVHIARLRAAIRRLVPAGECIRVCRGIGYRLESTICG